MKNDDRQTDIMADPPVAPLLTRLGARLSWKEGSAERSLPITGRALLGSSDQADVVLADHSVSRLHCVLETRDDGVWLTDLSSRNGSYVDHLRVREARVPDNATLQLGGAQLNLRYEREPRAVELWPTDRFGELLGRSAKMRELFALLARIADREAPVLIQGETGTGKEVLARSLHLTSARVDAPFVVVDCVAVPETLIESELFGHVRGAFTGASESRAGAIESASGGTVFLDEIGDLPLHLQSRLLRVVESGSLRRIGDSSYRRVDVRFMAATHRNLIDMVSQGSFREDLYFRLAVLPVTLPPLRERPEDIPLLVEHFLPGGMSLGAEVLADLCHRPWYGNVRELRNAIERLLALGSIAQDESPPPLALPPVPLDRPLKEIRERWLDHLERTYLGAMVERHGRSLARIADAAGIDRSYVHRLMRKHDL